MVHFQNRNLTLQESKCLCQDVKSQDQPFIGPTNIHHSFCRLSHSSYLKDILSSQSGFILCSISSKIIQKAQFPLIPFKEFKFNTQYEACYKGGTNHGKSVQIWVKFSKQMFFSVNVNVNPHLISRIQLSPNSFTLINSFANIEDFKSQ